MRHMSNFDKSFRNHQCFFWIFFSVVLALIVSYLIALGVVTYKAASTVAAQDYQAQAHDGRAPNEMAGR